MRLTPAEMPGLPGAVALLDSHGMILASTPEWQGPGPGTARYGMGRGGVMVSPAGTAPGLQAGVKMLVEVVCAAAAGAELTHRDQLTVLAAGLRLVGGLGVDEAGDLEDVARIFRATLPGRAAVRAVLTGTWSGRVAAPPVAALALLQLVANAERHARVDEVEVHASPGPTLTVSWRAQDAREFDGARVTTSRSVGRRERWGMGFVRQAADAMGGVVTDVYRPTPGRAAVGIGLGTARLMLPLARAVDGRLEEANQAWEEETGGGPGASLNPGLLQLEIAAAGRKGETVAREHILARAGTRGTWMMIPPGDPADRAREVIGGLAHEQALWTAPEPYSTRGHALSLLLAARLGGEMPSASPAAFKPQFDQACSALGIPSQSPPDVLDLPDPRTAAFICAELGAAMVESGGAVGFAPGPGAGEAAVTALLRPGPGGVFLI
ncbi:MAG: hypothetical protein ACYDGR_03220 [Candidatus Dormibacteria bacterium]